jgi:hypothetical protein
MELTISEFVASHDPQVPYHIASEVWARIEHQKEEARLQGIANDFNSSSQYRHAVDYLRKLADLDSIKYVNYDTELASYDPAARHKPEFTQVELGQDINAIRTLHMNRLVRVISDFETLVMITRQGARVAEMLD